MFFLLYMYYSSGYFVALLIICDPFDLVAYLIAFFGFFAFVNSLDSCNSQW